MRRPVVCLVFITFAFLLATPAVAAASGLAAEGLSNPLMFLAVQQAKLAAPEGGAGDLFGWSVALDGDTALVGAHRDTVGTNVDQGSAYIFVRSGTGWSLQQKLVASDGTTGDFFGCAVALSGDTALVGAFDEGVAQGSAYVFVRSGASWSEQQKLVASDGEADDEFGCSVALDGDTALVGAVQDSTRFTYEQGSAYVFVRSGTSWSEQQKLVASDGETWDFFGGAVALDGDTALVGATGNDNPLQGSAYVFVRSGAGWGLQQKLAASGGEATGGFGNSVALFGDTALVCEYVFVRSGGIWIRQQMLVPTSPDDGGGRAVWAVALSGDVALLGSEGEDINGQTGQGSAFLFVRSGRSWRQQQRLVSSDGGADDAFGCSLALSGHSALLGARGDDVGDEEYQFQGSAYVFDLKTVTDSTPPTTSAFAATVKRGSTAVLKYRVNDPVPNGGTATVRIKVKSKAGKMVKTLKPVVKSVNTPLTWKFPVPRTWRAGIYDFYVYATDKAGNTQSRVGHGSLKVK